MTEQPVRVLVCDDGPDAARMRRLLEHGGTIDVVATPGDATSTLAAVAALAPDVVVIAADHPRLGGIETVEHVMASTPVPIVVVGATQADAALAAGALDTWARAAVELAPDCEAAAAFRRRLRRLAAVRVIHHPRARLRANAAKPARLHGRRPVAIGIVASTGGPPALRRVVAALPPSFPVPILVVQHMSAGFTRPFTDWLAALGGPPVRLAESPGPLAPGVWIAAEGAHLVVADGSIELDVTTTGVHCPSGDVLLASLAHEYGAAAAAIVLSGMGNDGARGARCIREAGGLVIAQDESTSAIYGMPRAAVAAGVDVVMALDDIAPALLELAAVPA